MIPAHVQEEENIYSKNSVSFLPLSQRGPFPSLLVFFLLQEMHSRRWRCLSFLLNPCSSTVKSCPLLCACTFRILAQQDPARYRLASLEDAFPEIKGLCAFVTLVETVKLAPREVGASCFPFPSGSVDFLTSCGAPARWQKMGNSGIFYSSEQSWRLCRFCAREPSLVLVTQPWQSWDWKLGLSC